MRVPRIAFRASKNAPSAISLREFETGYLRAVSPIARVSEPAPSPMQSALSAALVEYRTIWMRLGVVAHLHPV